MGARDDAQYAFALLNWQPLQRYVNRWWAKQGALQLPPPLSVFCPCLLCAWSALSLREHNFRFLLRNTIVLCVLFVCQYCSFYLCICHQWQGRTVVLTGGHSCLYTQAQVTNAVMSRCLMDSCGHDNKNSLLSWKKAIIVDGCRLKEFFQRWRCFAFLSIYVLYKILAPTP